MQLNLSDVQCVWNKSLGLEVLVHLYSSLFFYFQLIPWAWRLQPWVMIPPQGQVLPRCRWQPTYTGASFLVFSYKQYLPSLVVFRFDYSHYLPSSIFTCNWVNSLASPLRCPIGISKIVCSTLNLSPSPTSPSYFGSHLRGSPWLLSPAQSVSCFILWLFQIQPFLIFSLTWIIPIAYH